MIGDHDRQESDADMQRAILLLQHARQKLEALEVPASPMAGSMLYEEGRRHTAYEPIDTIAAQHRARATDNLERVFDLMFDTENGRILAYPYALYSLIRTAIESASLALWVVSSESKSTRVFRSLQLTYRDTNERRQFVELVGDDADVAVELARQEKIFARLNELKDTVGALKQKELRSPPKYTEILRSLSEHAGRSAQRGFSLVSPLVIWKISTAFIHGSGQLVHALSDFRQMTDFNEGIAMGEVTPSLRMLAGAIHAVVDLIARADQRFIHLATHDYAGRSLV